MQNNYGANKLLISQYRTYLYYSCKVIVLNLLCSIFYISSLLIFCIAPIIVIAPFPPSRSRKFSTAIAGRAITLCGAIQKKCHDLMYKSNERIK